MSFDETRFPENIVFGLTGGPSYSTDVLELYSGFEQRNQNWPTPRMHFNATHDVKSAAEMSTLINFFRNRKGKANGFRFRDWSDYKAIAQNIGTGTGSLTNFQLRKAYTNNSTTEYRICTKIVASGSQVALVPAVYVNGVLKTPTTDYTLNYNTGVVTFVTAPGNGLAVTADFEFDVPVRFDTDAMTITHNYGHEFSWSNISLIEVRI